MFSNFYRLDFHSENEICVVLANLRWSTSKDRIENQTSLDLVMVIGNAYLSTSELNSLFEFGVVNINLKTQSNLF